ncbi:sphingosine-1-phosphate lyase 1 [Thecamonas trahens ATCC 50062]|uniref:sphinganine-1-phosphate aldolase n=1 Tax=Thecamonas trahens ATCC 50062 TaxID=461836 RepID=A0A0L0D4B9_THETB|nr:sphingosine-1-phosphate lyase 1 [Thecamonas trahens ATCC 50062]KNC46143.1 sphingosine-1-phosphate lyase 1 [Thecamonas trahens ATCC 50062]|eukprot:XP_013763120.1 sphingosine-1-phosphate lyase 1 [Thecamonas trahens ATCC 50062]
MDMATAKQVAMVGAVVGCVCVAAAWASETVPVVPVAGEGIASGGGSNATGGDGLVVAAADAAAAVVSGVGLWLENMVEAQTAGLRAWQIGLVSILGYVAVCWVVRVVSAPEPLLARAKKEIFRLAKTVPAVRAYVDGQIEKQLESMGATLFDPLPEEPMYYALPDAGLPVADVLAATDRMLVKGHVDWAGGKVSGTVYHGGKEWTEFMGAVVGKYIWTNPLHADVFPGVRRMEAEVVAMTLSMYNAPRTAGGVMTTGGTESILMACKAYRDRGYERGISAPEMVVPDTIHAAFDKAAGYFGIHMVHVPVDPVTRAADVGAMAAAINRNTIFIAGSAPSYPHGVVDPIQELAALAASHDIGMHVDCCLGGFLVPFMADAGYPLAEVFDFRAAGVTSISADTHKYGFAPKGASVVMFSTQALRHYMYFVAPDWPGGIYASPSICGSRAGSAIAGTWAAMMAHGRAGYVASTKSIVETTRKIAAGVAAIDGLFLYGSGEVCVVGFASNIFDIYLLSSAMSKRGWNLSTCQQPSSLHLAVTVPHTQPGVADEFLADLAECTAVLMKDPIAPRDGIGAIYGMAESIPDRSLVSQMAHGFIDVMYRVDTTQGDHLG